MQTNCFLCKPDPELVYVARDGARALCGLGPLMPRYSVVGPIAHVPSAADAVASGVQDGIITLVEEIRATLDREFGPTVMTEHGRVPVCVDSTRDQHCYHAHFLMFPGAPSVIVEAVRAYRVHHQYRSLEEALANVPEDDEYLLLSESVTTFSVLVEPRRAYRQFARGLVANALGMPERTSWRLQPAAVEARLNARRLRGVFSHG